ncbi:hypothetical protein OPT61_g3676 [Boeremia exigua]|uniref:Uncharacterized protein n=1 Tax=Boeremia exigua TaxID=749465 RepID=A0ACC2IGY8_9PLEO|nr:hypothetical protein OPT61_g3676 [Boeremia exigua]
MVFSLSSSPVNSQLQSPLFGTLPGEIRNQVFSLALMQHDDEADTYPTDSYWYRPGFSAPQKSNSALLQTCKMAYAEGQKVFLSELEWAFWFGTWDLGGMCGRRHSHCSDRGPEGRSRDQACINFCRSLPPQAVQSLQKYRFFTQMYWLEGGSSLRMLLAQPQFRPTQLTITIRYSDWWNWELDQPLRMREDWLRSFRGNPGLRTLRVEYETLTPKREEMLHIVERNRKWKLPVKREGYDTDIFEGYLVTQGSDLKEWKWRGTSKLGGLTWSHHAEGETVEYVVIMDTWRFSEGGTV